MKWRYSIYLFCIVWLCVSCDRTDEVEMEIPFSISLSSSMMRSKEQAPVRRMPGDPGTNEVFDFPNYIYLFIFRYDGVKWALSNYMEETIADGEWRKTRYIGPLRTEGDSVYTYSRNLNVVLPSKGVEGRVYAIASSIPLSFSKTPNTITEIADLLNLKIDISATTTQENLQNIYTTPYNYILPSTGRYYGTFDNDNTNVTYLDLVLYHIAAKVDLKWSVAKDKRINRADPSAAIRLTRMKVKNLLNTSCYAFRPMENVVPSEPLSSGREIEFVRPADEGLWWEGRAYFYTIPYTIGAMPGDYFPLQMEMETNESGNIYRPTLNLTIDTSSPFVPWLRAMFNINAPLENKAETKNY